MSDKAPFFVTAIVAAIAWTFSHAVDRLVQTPFLKYSVEDVSADSKQSTFINIHNITRDRTFKNVNIIVTTSTKDTVIDGSVIPHQPAFEGNQSWSIAGRTFNFTFPEIEPGWQFDVSVLHRTKDPISVRLSTTEKQGFYAVRPSLETFLVEDEMTILSVFFVLASIVLGISLWLTGRPSPPETPELKISVPLLTTSPATTVEEERR